MATPMEWLLDSELEWVEPSTAVDGSARDGDVYVWNQASRNQPATLDALRGNRRIGRIQPQ